MPTQEAAEATKSEKEQQAYQAAGRAELDAMCKAFDALHKLPYGARGRALRWLEARLDNRVYDEEPPF